MSATEVNESNIKERITELDGLPVFPATATQILNETRKGDVDVAKVTQLVEFEPAIGAKVLQLANSPLYGTNRPITTIGHAIVMLGFRAVSQLAISIATKDVFNEGDPRTAKFREKIFQQSLACATHARAIANQMELADPDEAFLSGVMQDIGKLVLLASAPQEYSELMLEIPNGYSAEQERNWIGIDHTEIGQKCGKKWGLPPTISQAIFDHHSSVGNLQLPLSQGVAAANYFSRIWHIGFAENESVDVDPEIENAFETFQNPELKSQCEEQFAAVCEICLG
ncbi:MAG: HDOD domain-containing protein [Planctomycetota bacterium]